MSLINAIELLAPAQADGYGIGAFNVIGLEHAQAIAWAAELERSPVILQLSQNAIAYNHGSLGPIAQACHELATSVDVPVALHLDHATTWELCDEALDFGFGSVMLDASALSLEDNVARTAGAARRVHDRGATIEAELGVVGGKDGATSSAEGNTDPELARWYVEATGIDSLAVAVGTSHYMTEQTATVDLNLIARLRAAVDVPLVLHGGSGVPDGDLREIVRRGIVKVNTATELNKAFTHSVSTFLAENPTVVDPRKYLSEARAAMVEVVRRRIQVLGSSAHIP